MVSREAVGWRGRNAIHPFFWYVCPLLNNTGTEGVFIYAKLLL
jgi:hypothetical protein